ncbi:hypothetical protein ADL15_43530 [Actinoplanes awajinensis subsp. mycoplanecinus]|uniref:Uncharacterized protein n=1 Tax=Actinoplanes awajinensis subsp. mycoplanecinus TaxID=135947 RepID=A0A101JCQ5_9ACTN|nr:hypothetical protein ADL15_43530 [Actinoplanes awajinensis subsp. mycoplanecinus]
MQTGDSCELSIPAIEVVVTSFTRYPAPEDIGWLPRPFAVLAVAEVFDDRDEEDTAQALYLSEAVPLTIERLGRLP